MAPSTCTRCLHSHAQSRGGRPSAAAAQPSDSRALPSLASQARGCSPCACSHRRARLAAGRSSATTPWPPPTTSTAPRCAAALTALSPRRPRPRRRPRRPPPCARGCRCHRQPARPRCRPRRPRRRRPRPRRPPPLPLHRCSASQWPRLVSRIVCVYSAGVGMTFLLVLLIMT